MKNRKNKFLALGLGVVLGLSCVFSSYATSADLKDAKKKVSSLQEEKKKVQDTLKQLEGLKSDAAAYVKELDKKLTSLDSELSQLEKDISAKEDQIENTKAELEEAKAVEKEQYASMKLRIQYMYENGNASYISMILDSKSIGDFLNRAEYITELTSYDRQMLEELQAKKNEVEAAKASLDKQLADLQVLQENAEAEKAATEQLMEAKNQEIAQVNASITDAQNQIHDLENDIAAQQELVSEMESIEARRKAEEESRKKAEEESRKAAEEESKRKAAEAASRAEKKGSSKADTTTKGQEATTSKSNTSTNQTTSNGKFIWPLTSNTYISSYFSMRNNPFGGSGTEFHNGIDIPASTGTAVMAVSGGQVAWSSLSSSAGNWIGIDHGNGIYSVYMHMSSRLVKEGDYVTAGQTIGLVGSTGRSTAPHLHLSIRLNGSYVDPLDYVSP
mgnify:CR=1 FL=1